jgi:peptidoglycan/xylan/chitin deacetylase (PgdA/CDA1 family)
MWASLSEQPLKLMWSSLTMLGIRRTAKIILPHAYRDTTLYFQGVGDCVALTIDDGLSRNGASASLVEEVRLLLAKHNARCTFFVCSKYLEGVEEAAGALVTDGHELGNHMSEDLPFHFHKLPRDEFARQLRATTAAIEALPGQPTVRWFRAPQAIYTEGMRAAVAEQQLQHALGDSYCDDWALAHNAPFAAQTMLRQCQPGSILIMHSARRRTRRELVGWPHEESTRASVCRVRVRRPSASA